MFAYTRFWILILLSGPSPSYLVQCKQGFSVVVLILLLVCMLVSPATSAGPAAEYLLLFVCVLVSPAASALPGPAAAVPAQPFTGVQAA